MVEVQERPKNNFLELLRQNEKETRENGSRDDGCSVPENGTVEQLESHLLDSIEEIFSKSKRAVGELADNIDKIELSMTETVENQKYSGNGNIGDNVMRDITNSQPPKRARHVEKEG